MRSAIFTGALAPFALVVLALQVGCNMGTAPEKPRAEPAKTESKTESAPPAAKNAAAQKLGAPITEKPIALGELAKNPGAFTGKSVATTGKVIAVCEAMGCWMELEDPQGQAHVKMAGHAISVPKSAKGKIARVQGKLIKGEGDEECKKEAADQMGKPVAKLELEATGVEID
jgi:hypothetical protein